MHIHALQIKNFRRLQNVEIELASIYQSSLVLTKVARP